MINKEFILNADGSIKKDFQDRNIPQYANNQVSVNVLIPSQCFTGLQNYAVILGVSRIVSGVETTLNSLVMTVSKSITLDGVLYVKYSAILSYSYTELLGTLKVSPYIQTTATTTIDDESVEVISIQQSFTNSNLNVIKSVLPQYDASMQEADVVSTIEAQLNGKKIYTFIDSDASSLGEHYYNLASSYNPNATQFEGCLVMSIYDNETRQYMPYLNDGDVELLEITKDGKFYRISGVDYSNSTYTYTRLQLSYSKSEIDSQVSDLQTQINGKVDKTTKVNDHALSGDITITKGDVGLGNVANYGVDNTPSATGSNKYITSKAVYDALQVIYGILSNMATDATITDIQNRLSAIETLIGDDDGDDDNILNTLKEIITSLSGLGEDANILSLINSKASTSDLTAVENQIHQLLSTTTAPTESGDDLIISTSDIVGTSKENDLLMYIDSDNITTLYKITNITNGTATLSLVGNFATGGGTSVIANPALTGTEDGLTSLQIGNTKYHIGEKPVLLWENTAQNIEPVVNMQFASQNITLSEAYTNFKYIIFEYTGDFGSKYLLSRRVYEVKSWSNSKVVLFEYATGGEQYRRNFTFASATTISVDDGKFNGSTNNAALVPRYIYGCNDLSQLGGEGGTQITTFTPSTVAELHSVLTDITTNHLKNCRVYLPNETLDMASTFETYHDLPLGDDVEVIGQPKSKIVCNYLGSNATALENYSVFNKVRLDGGGFTLKNVVIEASRVRYCVHDDNGYNEDIYENNYINCNMSLDNTSNEEWSENGQCIGGGFGKNGIVNIFGGSYNGKCTPNSSPNNDRCYDITYHNSSHAQAQSQLNIHNVYCVHTIRVSYYGSSTLKTKVIISNCSLLEAPRVTQETNSYSVVNVEMLQFNNTIRQDVANAKKGLYDTLTTNADGSITINKYTKEYKIDGTEEVLNAWVGNYKMISVVLPINETNLTDFVANVPTFLASNFSYLEGLYALNNNINSEADNGNNPSKKGTRITLPCGTSDTQTKRLNLLAYSNIKITYKSSTLQSTETIY